MTELISRSVGQTKKIGADFAKKIVGATLASAGQAQAPITIGLVGDLGSGKTTFVQGMALGLGIDPRYYVNSPTFTMVNEYQGGARSSSRLIHVDLYRVDRPEEVATLALEEYRLPGNIVVVEWAEKLPAADRADFEVRFDLISGRERKIRINSVS